MLWVVPWSQEWATGLDEDQTLLQAWEHSHLPLLLRPCNKSFNFIRSVGWWAALRVSGGESFFLRAPCLLGSCSPQSLPGLQTLWPLQAFARLIDINLVWTLIWFYPSYFKCFMIMVLICNSTVCLWPRARLRLRFSASTEWLFKFKTPCVWPRWFHGSLYSNWVLQ